jgi:hypothetical protein
MAGGAAQPGRGCRQETGGFFPTVNSSFLCALGKEKTLFLSQETISMYFHLFPR